MKAVSASIRPPSEVSRPFDGERDGFVLGEGAAVLVLESLRRAKRRRATIYAEVTGYGSSFDAYGITRPEPEGKGAALSMTAALREARLDPADVDYINAHGTSTRLNDLMETVAVKRVFGHRAASIPMSSQKSMVGHLIGASGAVEAAATAMSLERGRRPADDQPGHARPRLRPRLRPQHGPRDAPADGPLQQLRLRRPERLARDGAGLSRQALPEVGTGPAHLPPPRLARRASLHRAVRSGSRSACRIALTTDRMRHRFLTRTASRPGRTRNHIAGATPAPGNNVHGGDLVRWQADGEEKREREVSSVNSRNPPDDGRDRSSGPGKGELQGIFLGRLNDRRKIYLGRGAGEPKSEPERALRHAGQDAAGPDPDGSVGPDFWTNRSPTVSPMLHQASVEPGKTLVNSPVPDAGIPEGASAERSPPTLRQGGSGFSA